MPPQVALTSARCTGAAHAPVCPAQELVPSDLYDQVWLETEPIEHPAIRAHPLAAHVPLWSAHVLRLVHATSELARLYPKEWGSEGWSVDEVLNSDAVHTLWEHVQSTPTTLRASLRIRDDRTSAAVIAPYTSVHGVPMRVRLDTQPTSLTGATAALKTDQRDEYDASRGRVHATLGVPAPGACFDTLLWTESEGDAYLTESSIANILWARPGQTPRMCTPPLRGLIPGLVLQALLRQGQVVEMPMKVDDVRASLSSSTPARLYLCNAVRGVFPVEWVDL